MYGRFQRASWAVSIHFFASALNSSTDMPVNVAAIIFSRSRSESFAMASPVAGQHSLERLDFGKLGFASTTAGTRSSAYITKEYMGCSTHSVPS